LRPIYCQFTILVHYKCGLKYGVSGFIRGGLLSCHAYSIYIYIYIYIPTVEGPEWLNELGSWIT